MLRLYDIHTGEVAEVAPARPGQIRVCECVTAEGHLSDLRLRLLADIIRRAAEHRRSRVVACSRGAVDAEGRDGTDRAPVHRAAAELNIHPLPRASRDGADIIVRHLDGGGGQPGHESRYRVAVAAVAPEGALGPDGATAALERLTPGGLDPLVLRLSLLEQPYRKPVNLTGGLRGAQEKLARWRGLVARWAEQPSRPMPRDEVAGVISAVEENLDTPAALAALTRLAESPDVAAGAKFEAFVHLDQLLGLDLARDIGKT